MLPLDRARAGEPEGFAELFDDCVSSVYFICEKLLGKNQKAVETAKVTLKSIFSSISSLPEDAVFSEWIKVSAAINCCKVLRKFSRDIFLELSEAEPLKIPELNKGQSLNMRETAELVEGCFDSLPKAQRVAVLLYYYNGLTLPQIAKIMCVPTHIAKENLLKGRDIIESLSAELRRREITTCKMTLLPIFDYCATAIKLPADLVLSAVYTPPEAEKTAEKKRGFSKKGGLVFLAFFCIIVIAAALLSSLHKNENKLSSGENSIVSTPALSPSLSSEPEILEPQPIIITQYKPTEIKHFDCFGEPEKSALYSYNNEGELISSRSVTEVFDETLHYKKSSDKGSVTVKNQDGELVSKTEYNKEGYPKSEAYPNGDTATFSWKYKRDSSGKITEAAYKSEAEGRLEYKYDERGRLIYFAHTHSSLKDSYSFTLSEEGLPTNITHIDSLGEETAYIIEYNYEELSFICSKSSGESYSGRLRKFQKELSEE